MLGLGDGTSIYTVWQASIHKGGDVLYHIWTSASAIPSPRATGVYWRASKTGTLIQIQYRCTSEGVAQQMFGFPYEGRTLVPPRAMCLQGEAITYARVIGTTTIRPGSRTFVATELTPGTGPTGDRVTLAVRRKDEASGYLYPIENQRTPEAHETEVDGDLTLEAGTRIQVYGWRYWNCVVEAWSIKRLDLE